MIYFGQEGWKGWDKLTCFIDVSAVSAKETTLETSVCFLYFKLLHKGVQNKKEDFALKGANSIILELMTNDRRNKGTFYKVAFLASVSILLELFHILFE